MRPVPRTLFGVLSFVPLLGVFVIAGRLASVVAPVLQGDAEAFVQSEAGRAAALKLLGGAVAVAFVQLALSVVVAVHTATRKDMETGEKLAWILGCAFVGSFALPAFFFIKLKPRAGAPPA